MSGHDTSSCEVEPETAATVTAPIPSTPTPRTRILGHFAPVSSTKAASLSAQPGAPVDWLDAVAWNRAILTVVPAVP